jgi:hypothetical protein
VGKRGGLKSAESLGERAKVRIAFGESIKLSQVDPNAEQPFERDVVTVFTLDVRRAPVIATCRRGEFGPAICVTAISQGLPFNINTRRYV